MKLEQCQLDYLKERGGNYDRKYGMFKILLSDIDKNISNVVELFGGSGIETYYINNNFNLKEHIVIDKDKRCCECINKMNNNVEVLNIDTFSFEYKNNIDLLVCDSVFNKKEFDNIINLLNKFNFKYLILTDTGVFNVRFNKKKTYEDYWNEQYNKLIEHGYYINKVKYSSDFGMILLTKNIPNKEVSISKLEKNEINTDWREYRDNIYNIIGGINNEL